MKKCTQTKIKQPSRIHQIKIPLIHSEAEFYNALAQQVKLPSYFSHNLDALWDFLSTDLEGPIEWYWLEHQQSKAFLSKTFYDQLMILLQEMEVEREDFTLIIGIEE
ncbi:barnase inhibitor [Pelistega sp. NLN82]|uniref:Barnase inhibitor n=1 Tax=Pelistega ratti TaxID=2652177 RepID=A0A6L9Y4N9_9BURK|nr:barstar family protein [Pelistega ratti]NEN74947.1 barnase inhibitor [Pelistega ratti]